MAAALAVDRELAKELWLNGLSLSEVAKKLGVKLSTLCAWKNREGWKPTERVSHLSQADATQAVAERLSNSVLRSTERVLCKAETLGLKDARTCKDVASAVSAAYATARKALGLDDNQVQRVLHVHLMKQARESVLVDAEVIASIVPASAEPAPDVSTGS